MSSLEHRGCRLNYRVVGDGPPVVMIQGAGVGLDGWKPQEEVLSQRFRCLVFDNRGYGASQPLGEVFDLEAMVDDTIALADAAGFDRFHVLGHSMGGLIALGVALRVPERIRTLALLNTFGTGAVPTRVDPKILWIGTRSAIGPRRWRRHAFLEFVMPPSLLETADKDALAAELGALFGHDLADRPSIVMKQLGAMSGVDYLPRLHELAGVPALIATGALDPLAPPSAAEALARALPDARLEIMADASHGAPIQHPARVNGWLEALWGAA